MSIEQRKCRLRTENPNPESLFKFYTQKACQFECSFINAKRITGCVPFYMPHMNPGIEALCTREYVAYFEKNMTEAPANCECLPDCEEVTFSYSTNTIKLDPDAECEKRHVLEAAWDNVNTVSDQQAWRYENIRQSLTPLRDSEIIGFDMLTRCKRKVKYDFAELIFELGNDGATEMEQTIQFTPVAILTLIGK